MNKQANKIEVKAIPADKQSITLVNLAQKTEYSDYININATAEEWVLEFGNRNTSNPNEIFIDKRIALSIFHAKRLANLMTRTVKRYEDAFGEIKETLDRLAPATKRKVQKTIIKSKKKNVNKTKKKK